MMIPVYVFYQVAIWEYESGTRIDGIFYFLNLDAATTFMEDYNSKNVGVLKHVPSIYTKAQEPMQVEADNKTLNSQLVDYFTALSELGKLDKDSNVCDYQLKRFVEDGEIEQTRTDGVIESTYVGKTEEFEMTNSMLIRTRALAEAIRENGSAEFYIEDNPDKIRNLLISKIDQTMGKLKFAIQTGQKTFIIEKLVDCLHTFEAVMNNQGIDPDIVHSEGNKKLSKDGPFENIVLVVKKK